MENVYIQCFRLEAVQKGAYGSNISRPGTWYLHGDLEDPEQPESPEDGQAEGACLGLEVSPDLLEGGERDDEGVEAVEGGLHVDSDAQRPHPQQHLEDEQPEENEFGSVWERTREIKAGSCSCPCS